MSRLRLPDWRGYSHVVVGLWWESHAPCVRGSTALQRIAGLGEEEWKADRMQRRLSQHVYRLEEQLDPVTILFYEKMLHALSAVANAAENTGELIRQMIVKA